MKVNEGGIFSWELARAPLTLQKMSAYISAAHDFGKERGVSGAHKNYERTNANAMLDTHAQNVFFFFFNSF